METPEAVNPAIEKIAVECEEAGATKWDVIRIVKSLTGLEGADEGILRTRTLELLRELNPSAAEVYSSFNKMQVRTSAERIEHFDRGNIIRSLLQETDITRGVAEKIGAEVEDQIKDLKIDYLNTSLIRALTDVKLLEYGHEEIHKQYARVGLPVFDIEQKLSDGTFDGNEALREYHWLRIIPREISLRHFRGELFINSVEHFSTKIYSYTLTPELERGGEVEALIELATCIRAYRQWVTLPVSIHGINYVLAPMAEKMGKKARARYVQSALRMLQHQYPSMERELKPSVSVLLYTPDRFDPLSDHKKTAQELGVEFIRQYGALGQPTFNLHVGVDSRYKLKLIRKEEGKGIFLLNGMEEDFHPLNGEQYSKEGFGFTGVVGVNGAYLHAEAGKSTGTAENQGKDIAESLKVLAGVRDKQLRSRAYLAEQGLDMSKLEEGLYVYAPPQKKEGESISSEWVKGFGNAFRGSFAFCNYIPGEARHRFGKKVGGDATLKECALMETPVIAHTLKEAGDGIAEGKPFIALV